MVSAWVCIVWYIGWYHTMFRSPHTLGSVTHTCNDRDPSYCPLHHDRFPSEPSAIFQPFSFQNHPAFLLFQLRSFDHYTCSWGHIKQCSYCYELSGLIVLSHSLSAGMDLVMLTGHACPFVRLNHLYGGYLADTIIHFIIWDWPLIMALTVR